MFLNASTLNSGSRVLIHIAQPFLFHHLASAHDSYFHPLYVFVGRLPFYESR
jgi:hypothetical protein